MPSIHLYFFVLCKQLVNNGGETFWEHKHERLKTFQAEALPSSDAIHPRQRSLNTNSSLIYENNV